MKSIMQEASSVMKAIEKAWENAGKPQEFSIKVFEEPKKNFIGMTVQSAKIGIFFGEKASLSKEFEKEKEKTAPVKKSEQIQKSQPRKEIPFKSEKTEIKEGFKQESHIQQKSEKEAAKAQKIVWTPEMVAIAGQWLTETLKTINLTSVNFSTQTSHYQLVINFNKPLLENDEKEQQLLRSFSLLLIQTLRHKLKRPLRGFKIIMARNV
jgi:predicted RNA-binding protein Jag